MKSARLALRVTTGALCALFLLGRSQPVHAQTEIVLFNFTVASLHPAGPLLMDSAGNFYGSSPGGGPVPGGYGTVWEFVNSSGTYTQNVLYTFGATSTDGTHPYRGVVMDSAGNLYGTTNQGGTAGVGTVFELVKSGGNYSEKILYNFGATPDDAASPYSNMLLDSAGNLFGTTAAGGTAGFGTVFELINTSGTYTETILHSFAGPPSDGERPIALLMDVSGNLYGITSSGGTQNYGTVFELVNSSGTYSEKLLYSFAGPPTDGTNPMGLSMDANGNFYGTTGQGTTSVNCCGTVFELVNNSGNYSEKILYNFTGGADGGGPNSAPIWDATGKFYGTTGSEVFELINSSGNYTAYVFHAFTGPPSDGSGPGGLILDSAGNLYGVTGWGGPNGYDNTLQISGYGTFFEIPNASAVNVIFSPNAINFGGRLMGTAGTTQSITVNNIGAAALTFGSSAVTRSGANVSDFAINSDGCSSHTLAPSTGTCTVSVTYAPTVIGPETASLSFADNGFGNPQVVPLSGTGQDFTLTALQSTATVSPGNSAGYTLNITPLGGFTGAVALSCAGAPANSTCTMSPATVTPDGTNFIQSGVLIWANGSSAMTAGATRPSARIGLSLLLGCVLGGCLFAGLGVNRARTRPIAMLLLFCTLAFTMSCGAGSGGGHAGYHGPPPASGTYTLTITGTSGGLSHNLALTLIIQ